MAEAFNEETIEDFKLEKALREKRTLTGTGKEYFSIRPGYNASVTINKAGSTATLKGTNDYIKGGNVDNAVFSTLNLSEGTTDYQKGNSAGLTGFEVDVTTYVSNVVVIILYYKLQN